jgi:hypothetical protein
MSLTGLVDKRCSEEDYLEPSRIKNISPTKPHEEKTKGKTDRFAFFFVMF